jgi:hypothetical protein
MTTTTHTSDHMKTGNSSTFNSIILTAFSVLGLVLVVIYFMAEIDEPEYLVYFAPILGLMFYCMYYVVNHKLDTNFLSGTYNKEDQDS